MYSYGIIYSYIPLTQSIIMVYSIYIAVLAYR